MEEPKKKDEKAPAEEPRSDRDEELWGADPDCDHEIRAKTMSEGGGIECVKCKGWFCY